MFGSNNKIYDLRLNCSSCGNIGSPLHKEGIVVVCSNCNNAWDGRSETVERKRHDAQKD